MSSQPLRTVPGMDVGTARVLIEQLQMRLADLVNLQLALKQAHWNIVGPNFQSIHEALDTHATDVRAMSDDVAERLRTLGGFPLGTAQAIAMTDTTLAYDIAAGSVSDHLHALDRMYTHVVLGHRTSIGVSSSDPVTEDLLIGQTANLELLQWFIRSTIDVPPSTAVEKQLGLTSAELYEAANA